MTNPNQAKEFPNPFEGLSEEAAERLQAERNRVLPEAHSRYHTDIQQAVARNVHRLNIPHDMSPNEIDPEEEFEDYLYDGVLKRLIDGGSVDDVHRIIEELVQEATEIFGTRN